MAFLKRIFLFVVINLLVILTISSIINIFNLAPYLSAYGLNYNALLIFCLLWGMGGALISLALSRPLAKMMLGVTVIDPNSTDELLVFLLKTVENLAQKSHLSCVPEVGIYKSHEVNAFATGMSKNRSIIAVSSGLLERMSRDEIEAILGHEMTHITNGDMVTLTLIQGITNAFVMFFVRILAFVLSGMNRNKESNSTMSYYLFTYLFEIVFMLLGSIIICYFSRRREYRADEGGANLTGKYKMIDALVRLKAVHDIKDPATSSNFVNTLKVSSTSGVRYLFATHPSLEDRIAALKDL